MLIYLGQKGLSKNEYLNALMLCQVSYKQAELFLKEVKGKQEPAQLFSAEKIVSTRPPH